MHRFMSCRERMYEPFHRLHSATSLLPSMYHCRVVSVHSLGRRTRGELTVFLQDWKKPPAAEAISGRRAMPTETAIVSFILAGDDSGARGGEGGVKE